MTLKPIKTYDSLVDQDGYYIMGLSVLAIGVNTIDEDGQFGRCSIGTDNMLEIPSITFIIDDNIHEQIDDLRVKLIDNKFHLVPREGYEFKERELETPEQRKIRELEEQLALLRAKR
ncbi:hypothetical protein [Staphylococcus hyicus]|uniref:Uncharacterized protein n=1 Tax=Staphylococcus hyicus TaxID=1284 RepID=A0ACD5FN85_STAHY|nr:hypothetical protein [Staphylococcus hyicus]AJC95730.1 hypothetical protein SHYC_04845 [Staphylococcus hyicus]MCQ9301340.1 hypothetical protein [Staphylococcus hyicus]MDP4448376.1 hypothetical protein [Staphylococcus hyicus]MDP4459707.1 hypothetical protein [Staphylococcus hyicus]MDP4462663.1 hypothetical protein [Staphylococcus hyicus]